jgi:hypothetical protein
VNSKEDVTKIQITAHRDPNIGLSEEHRLAQHTPSPKLERTTVAVKITANKVYVDRRQPVAVFSDPFRLTADAG